MGSGNGEVGKRSNGEQERGTDIDKGRTWVGGKGWGYEKKEKTTKKRREE